MSVRLEIKKKSEENSELELLKEASNLPPAVGITKNQVAKIESRLPELFRAKKIVGHSTSQSSYALQTLNMIDDSPMSRMKQCLSQIEHKYQAVKESYFNIEKKKLDIKQLRKQIPLDEKTILSIREKESFIVETQDAMGNALREVGMFQDMYEAIRTANNIPEVWTEHDYEKQEIANMVRRSFRIGIQSLTNTGAVSIAAVEFWEQVGIHPQAGEAHCRQYIGQVNELIKNNKEPDVRMMYEFLDGMAERFKDSYKFALARIGLKELGSEEFRI